MYNLNKERFWRKVTQNESSSLERLPTDVGIQEMNHFYMEMPPAKSSVHCDTQGFFSK